MSFGSLIEGQGSQVAKANSLFDALAPAALYARNAAACSGLAIGLFDGWVAINGVRTAISAYSGTLGASTISYVEANPASGAVSKNTTGFTPGYWPLHKITTGTATVTSWEVQQHAMPRITGYLAKTLPSDADYTLSAAEDNNDILVISGTLTATRNIVISLTPRQRTVHNNTGQSLQFIGASGTGVTVATAKRAIIYSDGTNIVRVMADT